MKTLQFRRGLDTYTRDSYLNSTAVLDSRFAAIDCAIGSSQFGISPQALAAHKAHDPGKNTNYPELFYDHSLKPALLARFGLSSERSADLFLGHGSFNLAERVVHKLVAPNLMLGVGPQFNEIPSEFVATGGEYLPIPIDTTTYDFPADTLINTIKRECPSIVYLDNPNNPLGRLIAVPVISEIVRAAEEVGSFVMIDEAYGDFVSDTESAISLTANYSNLAVIRSFSKGLGLAAARIGYMMLSHQVAERYTQLDVPFEPTLHSAELAVATLSDTTFIEQTRTTARALKARVMQALLSKGFHILPTHPATSILTAHRAHEDIVRLFASIGIAVEPGSAFRATHVNWTDEYCRIRIPQESDIDEFERRIKQFT